MRKGVIKGLSRLVLSPGLVLHLDLRQGKQGRGEESDWRFRKRR